MQTILTVTLCVFILFVLARLLMFEYLWMVSTEKRFEDVNSRIDNLQRKLERLPFLKKPPQQLRS